MSIVKHSKVRLTLLATMVAATSAFVAAPVQAKADPVFDDSTTISCGFTPGQVIASFDVVGKGKWVYLRVWVTVNGVPASLDWDDQRSDRTESIVWDERLKPGEGVMATLVNKKGMPFEGDGSTVTLEQPAACAS